MWFWNLEIFNFQDFEILKFFWKFSKIFGEKVKNIEKIEFSRNVFSGRFEASTASYGVFLFLTLKSDLKVFWSPNWGDFFTFISVLKTLKNDTKIIPIRWPEPLQKWPQKSQLLAISLRERFQACSRGRIGMKNRHFVEGKKRYKMILKSSRFDPRNPFKTAS